MALDWEDHIIYHSDELIKILRSVDAFVTKNNQTWGMFIPDAYEKELTHFGQTSLAIQTVIEDMGLQSKTLAKSA